ncbi:bola-like protein [Schizopora paradoxa]|uniref:Bola-like protein n=1 Tax=Schizopora paradoxa TaxID=27342 RepID=A0A0H2RDA4_9AGAM|nr:bola-like protein [Schizopora paradoxa]
MHAIKRYPRVPAINVIGKSQRFSVQRHAFAIRAYSTPPPDDMDEGERNIHEKLSKRFDTSRVQVQDVSGGCGTFYAITIASKAFTGIPTVKQHRLVNETLKSEISGIHGLQVCIATIALSFAQRANCHVVEDHCGRSLGIKKLLV